MKTLREIEQAIETLPLPERLRLYRDMPQLIGRNAGRTSIGSGWPSRTFPRTTRPKTRSMTAFKVGDVVSVEFPLSESCIQTMAGPWRRLAVNDDRVRRWISK